MRYLLSSPLRALAVVLLLASGGVCEAAFDHSTWDRVLKAHVNDIGEVDYAALKANRGDLDLYIQQLAKSSPISDPGRFSGKAGALAYWMNAYNAFVMRGVVDEWPTKSVRDLGIFYGFFRGNDYVAGGSKISLQDLENDIIRKRYNEPRIHFGIVCASISCPLLEKEAFTAENLERLLDRQTRRFVKQPRNVYIDRNANKVTLSAIFDWYKEDFGPKNLKDKDRLLGFILPYLSAGRRKELGALRDPALKFFDYDWSINAPGSRARSKNPLEREVTRH